MRAHFILVTALIVEAAAATSLAQGPLTGARNITVGNIRPPQPPAQIEFGLQNPPAGDEVPYVVTQWLQLCRPELNPTLRYSGERLIDPGTPEQGARLVVDICKDAPLGASADTTRPCLKEPPERMVTREINVEDLRESAGATVTQGARYLVWRMPAEGNYEVKGISKKKFRLDGPLCPAAR